MCVITKWTNEHMNENGIFGYKHTCSQEAVLKLAKAIMLFYGFDC